MGIWDKIKSAIGSRDSDSDASIANEYDTAYREIQDNEIDKYPTKRYQEESTPMRDLREVDMEESRPSYLSNIYSGYKERVSKYNEGQLEKQERNRRGELSDSEAREEIEHLKRHPEELGGQREGEYKFSLAGGLRETEGSKKHRREKEHKRIHDKILEDTVEATLGMGPNKKKEYQKEKNARLKELAILKAQKDIPIKETSKEKSQRLKEEREDERKLRKEYNLARAKAAGRASVQSGKSKKEARKLGRQTGSERQDSGIRDPFNQIVNPLNRGSEGRIPAVLVERQNPEPQPERHMSSHDMHRQQVYEETQRWKNEKMQQYQQQQGMPSFLMPPTHQQGRNQSQQPRFRNLFEREDYPRQGSKQMNVPKMYNPFENHQMREHSTQNVQKPSKESQPQNDLMKGVYDHSELNNAPRQQYKPPKAKSNGKPNSSGLNDLARMSAENLGIRTQTESKRRR